MNIPKSFAAEELTNGYLIRRAAADFSIPLITNLQLGMRLFEALGEVNPSKLNPKSWNEYKTI